MPIHFTIKSVAIFKAPNDPLSAILSSISGNDDNGTAGFLKGPDAGRCLIRSNKTFENQKAGVAVQLS